MPNIGPMEIAIVLIIALVVFGPSKLPELGKSAGKGFREFKESVSGKDEPTKAQIEEPRPRTSPRASAAGHTDF